MTTLHPLHHIAARWPEIEALLDEALALPGPDRPAWLDALRQRHPALRDTLAQLLRGHAQAETDDFLNTLPPLLDGREAPPVDSAAAGRLVGPWRLLSPLGRGGMGTVWLAERADGTFRRQVALKLPRLGWDDAMAQRMARERDILAALEHPHIARLYEASTDDQGRPYLAMEFVQGEPIDAWCTARTLPVRGRLALLLQVAQAVSHAHTRLVVHRDLKPANILVTPEGQVRLLDFGIAKLLEGEHTHETALTQLLGRAMTLDYASPEQIRGEALLTASDLYSLGVVAFELLTGARPYRLKRGSAAELEEAIAEAQPPLASSAAADAAAKKALRGDLDAILNRALKKRPDERYASVAAFAEDLERHLNREPVLARPDSRGYRLRRFIERHRLGMAATAALLLAVGAGTAASLWQASEARQQTRRAEMALNQQEAVNSLYIDAMTRLSATAGADAATLSRPHAVGRALQDTLQDALPRFGTRPAERAAMLGTVALQLNYASDFEGSLRVGRQYLDELKAQPADATKLIEAHTLLGRTLVQLGRLDEAEAMRRAGVDWPARADDQRALLVRLELVADLGALLNRRGQRAEAEALLQRSAALAEAMLPNHLRRAQLLRQLASLNLSFDDARALGYAREAAAIEQANGTAEPEEQASTLEVLAIALANNGELVAAGAARRQGHALWHGVFGRANLNVARAIGALALVVAQQGDHTRARQLLADEGAAVAAIDTPPGRVARAVLAGYELEVDVLSGDVGSMRQRLAARASPSPAALMTRELDRIAVIEAQAQRATGDGGAALVRLEALAARQAGRGQPTLAWLRTAQALALAQVAEGRHGAARDTALALARLLDSNHGGASWTALIAAEVAALAAARAGDNDASRRELARLESGAAPTPAAPSPLERAESALRRAEIRLLSGDAAAARAAAEAALRDLQGQHRDSPRLAQARALLESAAQRVRQ